MNAVNGSLRKYSWDVLCTAVICGGKRGLTFWAKALRQRKSRFRPYIGITPIFLYFNLYFNTSTQRLFYCIVSTVTSVQCCFSFAKSANSVLVLTLVLADGRTYKAEFCTGFSIWLPNLEPVYCLPEYRFPPIVFDCVNTWPHTHVFLDPGTLERESVQNEGML